MGIEVVIGSLACWITKAGPNAALVDVLSSSKTPYAVGSRTRSLMGIEVVGAYRSSQ